MLTSKIKCTFGLSWEGNRILVSSVALSKLGLDTSLLDVPLRPHQAPRIPKKHSIAAPFSEFRNVDSS